MAKHLLFIAGSDIDYFYDVESFLSQGDACLAKPLGSKIGGCVLNAASVCACLGSDVKVLDYLRENDKGTDMLLAGLKEKHVDTTNICFGEDVTNGTCLIMKKDDEKCIYVIEPERPFFKEDQKLQDLLFNSSYIYSLMHTLKISFKNMDILEEARKQGTNIIFDGGSQYKDEDEKKVLFDLADGLFMNETSFSRLKDTCAFEPLDYMFDKGLKFACITNGDKGVTCYTKNEIYKNKAIKVDVVDSTGAGDSFAGCFLHFLDKGLPIVDCLKYASYNGAYACLKEGGMAGTISEKDLFEFVKSKEMITKYE